jgi:hypothetical protein
LRLDDCFEECAEPRFEDCSEPRFEDWSERRFEDCLFWDTFEEAIISDENGVRRDRKMTVI